MHAGKYMILAAAMLLFISPLRAEFVGAGEEAYDLGKVVIQENSNGEDIGYNSNIESSGSFTGEALYKGLNPDVISLGKYIPGITLEEAAIGGFGAGPMAPSLFRIRGLGATPNAGILFLINDRPQSMAIWRHPLPDTIPIDSVESVEFIKGPSGVLYGNQAFGGVVNIKTKKMKEHTAAATIGSSLGNYYTQDHFINSRIKIWKMDLGFSAGYNSTAGARPNSDSYSQNYHTSAGFEFSDGWRIDANGDYAFAREFNPGPVGALWAREQEAVEILQRGLDIAVENETGEAKSKILFYTDSGLNNFIKTYIPGPGLVDGSYSDFMNYGARLMQEWNLYPGNVIKAGFDWQYFGGYFDNRSANPAAKKREERYENDYAPYLLLSQEVGIFGINAGVRYGINNKWGNEWVPQAGFKISVFEGNTLFLHASKGYKTPAMGSVIWSVYDTLVPEAVWQYEAGIEQKIEEKVTLGASIYQTEGSNLLQADAVDGKLKNTGTMLFRGVEGSLTARLFGGDTGGSVSYMEPGSKTAGQAYFTGRLFFSPKLFDMLGIKIEGAFSRDRFDSDNRQSKLEEYFIMNAGVSYEAEIAGSKADFYLNIDNIFNRQYQVKTGYPAPGFIIKGGLVLQI